MNSRVILLAAELVIAHSHSKVQGQCWKPSSGEPSTP